MSRENDVFYWLPCSVVFVSTAHEDQRDMRIPDCGSSHFGFRIADFGFKKQDKVRKTEMSVQYQKPVTSDQKPVTSNQ